MKFNVRTILFLALSAVFINTGCKKAGIVQTIKKEELFSLKYGNFENELNLFNLNQTGSIDTSIAMKNGLFYISNGQSKKILKMNSYGDLLTLYFNRDENPKPLFNNAQINQTGNSGPQEISTKKIIDYPFNSPSDICVDSKQKIYSVEVLPPERQENDKGRILKYVVLRFDGEKFIDYIGQQGPAGTPFPLIKGIYTTDRDELVVVCVVPEGIEVYWFSENGSLLHNVLIKSDDAPNPIETKIENSIYLKVENVIPDSHVNKLLVKIDYYGIKIDETSKVQAGIEYKTTYVYPLDVKTGKYGKPVEVPPYEQTVEQGFSKKVYKSPYDILGISGSWLFFMVPVENGYMVELVNHDNSRVIKRFLGIDNTNLLYQNFNLSNNGIISALLAEKDKCQIVWWRTDTLLDALHN